MRPRIWLPLSLLVIAATPRFAPALELRGFAVLAGPTSVFSDFQFAGEELIDPDSIWSFAGGGSLRWRYARRGRFELLTEGWFHRSGFEFDGARHEVDFLQIPILLRSAATPEASLYLVFGPSIGILLGHDPEPIFDRFRTLSLAGQAGIGMQRRLGRRLRGRIEFRFNGDLTNLYDPRDEGDTLESVRHRSLMLSFGVEF